MAGKEIRAAAASSPARRGITQQIHDAPTMGVGQRGESAVEILEGGAFAFVMPAF